MPTTPARWDPFADLLPMRREFERLLAPFQGGVASNLPTRWAPTADVIESDDAIVITAELPGVKDEDVEITVHDGVLRIAGERRLQEEVSDERAYRLERSYGAFERRFPLPPGVKEEDITAGIAYGVLKITIPKASAAEPRRIALGDG
ncbi:MAG TPA: Hsp20/alpha crystallin family protein [Miltoncostaeaceae bacterium]|nr:Hsp20/alpha crystallin family protein [Miltoncostaeaceae bacterium]